MSFLMKAGPESAVAEAIGPTNEHGPQWMVRA